MITFYCGINDQQWNYHPVEPGSHACISPVYGRTFLTKGFNHVKVPSGRIVIQDCGAFCDGIQDAPRIPGQSQYQRLFKSHGRIRFEEALERQEYHAEQCGYTSQITHRAAYDLLIDEKWEGGVRYKARWTEADAQLAVSKTVASARYLSQNRNGLKAILSAQGVSPKQYLACAREILPFLEESDIFGLGGWCITGKMPAQMLPVFRETMFDLIPFLGREGVKRVHVWGVIYPKALGHLLWLCDEAGIELSTDSAGPQLKPCMGEWGYAEWRDKSYQQPPVEIRGLERARHVEATREWLANFRSTPHYAPIRPVWQYKPRQLLLAM